jgi:hypothetical protein
MECLSIKAMRLMDHPLLKWGGGHVCPPRVATSYEKRKAKSDLDKGVVKDVKYFTTSLSTPYLLLEVECDRKSWSCVVNLDQAAYLRLFLSGYRNR